MHVMRLPSAIVSVTAHIASLIPLQSIGDGDIQEKACHESGNPELLRFIKAFAFPPACLVFTELCVFLFQVNHYFRTAFFTSEMMK